MRGHRFCDYHIGKRNICRSLDIVEDGLVDGEGHTLRGVDGIKEWPHLPGTDGFASRFFNRRMMLPDKRDVRPVIGWQAALAHLHPLARGGLATATEAGSLWRPARLRRL